MAMSPRNRAQAVHQRDQRALSNEYYFYGDESQTSLGGSPIVKKDGRSRVVMHPQAAMYWIDQGVIGLEAHDKVSTEAQNARAQFRRTALSDQPGSESVDKPAAKPQESGEAPAGRKERMSR